MSDIFREVDEEVRRDKAVEFWKKHQILIIAVGALVVAAAGGWRFYQNQRRATAEAAGSRYEAALQLSRDGKGADADAAFQEIIKQGPPGYTLLARFRAASELGMTNKTKAVSVYDGLANDASIGPLLQDVARLRAAALRLDDADLAETKTRLEPLAAIGRPLRASAREYLAIAALKAGDMDTAGRWLDALMVDSATPADMRARAEALQGLVGPGKAKG